jgi:hypothetical protein
MAAYRGRDLSAVHPGHPVVQQRHCGKCVLIRSSAVTSSSASATTSIEPLDASARMTPSRRHRVVVTDHHPQFSGRRRPDHAL